MYHELVENEKTIHDEALILAVVRKTDDMRLYGKELSPQYTETGRAKIKEIVIKYTGAGFENHINWPTLGVHNHKKCPKYPNQSVLFCPHIEIFPKILIFSGVLLILTVVSHFGMVLWEKHSNRVIYLQ